MSVVTRPLSANARIDAGPASPAAMPVSTKIPAPIMAPTPSIVASKQPRLRIKVTFWAPSDCCSGCLASMLTPSPGGQLPDRSVAQAPSKGQGRAVAIFSRVLPSPRRRAPTGERVPSMSTSDAASPLHRKADRCTCCMPGWLRAPLKSVPNTNADGGPAHRGLRPVRDVRAAETRPTRPISSDFVRSLRSQAASPLHRKADTVYCQHADSRSLTIGGDTVSTGRIEASGTTTLAHSPASTALESTNDSLLPLSAASLLLSIALLLFVVAPCSCFRWLAERCAGRQGRGGSVHLLHAGVVTCPAKKRAKHQC